MDNTITLIIGTQIERKIVTVSLDATIRDLIKYNASREVYQRTFSEFKEIAWTINGGPRIEDYDKPIKEFLDSGDIERGKVFLRGASCFCRYCAGLI